MNEYRSLICKKKKKIKKSLVSQFYIIAKEQKTEQKESIQSSKILIGREKQRISYVHMNGNMKISIFHV